MFMSVVNSYRTIFYLVLALALIDTIASFRQYDHPEPNKVLKNNDQNAIEPHFSADHQEQMIRTRSVLWPKICFRMSREPHDYRLRRNIRAAKVYVSQRPTRRCYPFDMR